MYMVYKSFMEYNWKRKRLQAGVWRLFVACQQLLDRAVPLYARQLCSARADTNVSFSFPTSVFAPPEFHVEILVLKFPPNTGVSSFITSYHVNCLSR